MPSFRIAVILALAAAAPSALAQGRGPWREPWREHLGPHLHLEVGVGGLSSTTQDEDPQLTISGPAGSFAFSVGGTIAPNVILGGELWDMVVSDPDLDVEGSGTFSTSGSSLSIVGLGPNLTVYLAPSTANVYLSATPSFTWTRADLNVPGYDVETRAGFGLRVAVGKEWWLGRSPWGLGLSGHLLLASNKETGQFHSTWGTVGGGVNFSVSWN
jgi:hypothetical protein